ncbi:hypothetical protein QO011_001578 [Labrys wisconsinensis]|uniref:Uncharacterized protein n=1 Tax=Labrys wisconsinensis TaxID=425677 RepID=A0ABU0J2T6_9HYPH|nr:hypothetical protein [Labrys wisconsinensis]
MVIAVSEYQYYEFQTVDRPLDSAAQESLRSLSSRARISPTRFVNQYNWGDFQGDPRELMQRWFDLHLYLANWGTRRLMLRLPRRFLDTRDLDPFFDEIDWVKVWTHGDHLLVDIQLESDDRGYMGEEGDEDDSGWLTRLAPLRADMLSGDLSLFYVLWLTMVQDEMVADDVVEPAGMGPLTEPLEALAEFFDIDLDLVRAAAAEPDARHEASSRDVARDWLAALPEADKTDLLLRLVEGDVHVTAELRNRMRKSRPRPSRPARTVGALRLRAQEIREERERAEAERQEAERRRLAAEAEKAQQVRLVALKRRGEGVWREIETEIERRNAAGYDRATGLLADLQVLAAQEGSRGDFDRRLASIRSRHETKPKLIERLEKLGGEGPARLL